MQSTFYLILIQVVKLNFRINITIDIKQKFI